MEEVLRNALSASAEVRKRAESVLLENEKRIGYLKEVFHVYFENTDTTLRKIAIIVAKNAILRQWHLNTNVEGYAEEKEWVKKMLVEKTLGGKGTGDVEFLILCVEGISKFHFYEQWPELYNYFLQKNSGYTEVEIKLLKVLMKTQIRRRAKIRQFKTWVEGLYPLLVSLWKASSNTDLDKIILRCLTVLNDPEMISNLLSKAEMLLSTQTSIENLRILIKGLNLIENTLPSAFVADTLQKYLQVNYSLLIKLNCMDNEHLPLIRQAAYNLRQLLPTSETSAKLLEGYSLQLLQKCLISLQHDPIWEQWSEGCTTDLIENAKSTEENYMKKLASTLLSIYPHLLSPLSELCTSPDTLNFSELHSLIITIGLLPKVLQTSDFIFDVQAFIEKIVGLSCEGFQRKVICKDLLILIRKWAGRIQDLNSLIWVVFNIRDLDICDEFIIYHCLLTLKEILQFDIQFELTIKMIEKFGLDIFNALNAITVPAVVWSLVSVLSAIINNSRDKMPNLIQLLKEKGLQTIMYSKTEIVVIALCDMFMKLIRIYPDEDIVMEYITIFLHVQLTEVISDRVWYLWHFFIEYMELEGKNTDRVDTLLRFIKPLAQTDKKLAVKIVDGYQRLYISMHMDPNQVIQKIT